MSVAIRAITRLVDADDVNVTVGAGVDEYALTWDNDTARFVLRAPIAGLLATGATTGATAQAQAFTNGVVTPYDAPAADGVAAWQVRKADKTAAVLNVDTTNGRVGIETNVPTSALSFGGTDPSITVATTDGADNSRLLFSGGGAISISRGAYFYFSGNEWVGAANSRGRLVFAAGAPTTPVGNDGTIAFFTSSPVDTAERLFITSAGMVGVGTTVPGSLLHGLLTSAATNAVTNVVTIGHDTSGTAANGFGAGELFALESSTTAAQNAARIRALWYDATHATRKADLVLTAYDTAEREGLRIRGNGSAPAIGFLGAAPAARIAHVADPTGGGTVDAEARSAINSILATLETFGFHATS